MKLLFFCPLWGSEELPFGAFLKKVVNAGYDGVEMSFSMDPEKRTQQVNLLKEHGLQVIAQHWETIDKDYTKHAINFESRLRNLAAVNPLFINSQTGKDYYSMQQNCGLIELANSVALETGTSILHETHRGKFLFAAHLAADYLSRIPELKLVLDISHWCCVAETFLADQEEAVEAAISRTYHIHARVGHTQGPQIMDPRAPEHQVALDQHRIWWQRVVDKRRMDGLESLTITPEFGAPPYLPLLPYTKEVIYDQWEVNIFMMNFLRNHLN